MRGDVVNGGGRREGGLCVTLKTGGALAGSEIMMELYLRRTLRADQDGNQRGFRP